MSLFLRKNHLVWAGVPSLYFELLDKLQKQMFRTVGPSFAASLEPMTDLRNVARLSVFYRHYFDRCSFLFLKGGLLVILIDCMIFLSAFLDFTRMSMSTVSFLEQLDPGILYL